MVSRCPELTRAVVVDLDGTLIRQNSFRLYVRAGLTPANAPAMLYYLLLRKCNLLSHNAYREHCMRLAGFSRRVLERLAALATPSEAVRRFIDARSSEGYRIILATAALQGYVGALWQGEFVATTHDSGHIILDCRGEAKLQAVTAALDGKLPEYAISDSPADYPLLQAVADAGGQAILANPDLAARRFYARHLSGLPTICDLDQEPVRQ